MARSVRDAIAAMFGTTEAVPATGEPLQPGPSPLPVGHISIELLAEPVLIVGATERIVAANYAAVRLGGERIVGAELVVAFRHPSVVDAVRAAREHGLPVEREISGVGREEGLYRLRVVPDSGALLLIFTDISQQRLAERMRADFVANASHELRTPLATILGFVETLQGPAAEDETARARFLEIMGREANRMSRLIDDLLSLSRIELDKYLRPVTAIQLPPLLADVGKTLAMRLESDARVLNVEIDTNLPRVTGDRDQILQVLHNLVSNALKYGRSGTPIRLTAQRVGSQVRVAVADQGDGIAPEHLPRLTERFYRIDSGRSRQMGGTGLGLAIVKHIVERHRGQLDIASRPGEGTIVSFTLPVEIVPDPTPHIVT